MGYNPATPEKMSSPPYETTTQPLQLNTFYSVRSAAQYYQSWVATLFYARPKVCVVEKVQARIDQGGQVISCCRCGACRIVCRGAPRLVTVCHCSVCRYDEAYPLQADNAPAPSFAAVRREACYLDVDPALVKDPNNILVYRNSSDFARRGRCSLCETALVMDYEWFEPETIWLTNPKWGSEGEVASKQVE